VQLPGAPIDNRRQAASPMPLGFRSRFMQNSIVGGTFIWAASGECSGSICESGD
jgi:hypothetical protein